MESRAKSAPSNRQTGRSGALESRVLRRETGNGDQGRLHRLERDGRPNASIPTPQPVLYRPMFSAMFVSRASIPHVERMGLRKRLVTVQSLQTVFWASKPAGVRIPRFARMLP
jgi:hypothetical protein